jgi:hypothetical protein
MKQYTIEVIVEEDIDLEHMQTSVSNATYQSDNVTVSEQLLIIKFIEQLIKKRDVDNKR